MSTQGKATRYFRSGRGLVLSGCLFIAVTIIAACFAVWDLRVSRIEDEMKDAQSLSVVLAEQTARTIQAVDLIVQQTQAMVVAKGINDPGQFKLRTPSEEMHVYLASRLKNLPQADALALIDVTGKVTSFSRAWPTPFIDTSDREYFQFLRDHNTYEAFIGPPIQSKVNGAWTITIARRVNGPNGEFLGVVAGYVEARYFEDLYKAVGATDGQSIGLFRRDGTLISRYPKVDGRIGEKLSNASSWYNKLADGGGMYRTPGYLDGIPRIISVQPVHGYPLAVTIGISEYVALAPWRHQSITIAVSALGAVIGFAVLFYALAVQFGRLERRSSELAQSESRFRGFALTSSDWFWETDERHRISYMSDGVSTTGFGVKPSELVGRTRMEIAANSGSEPAKWQAHFELLERHEPFRDFAYIWKNSGGLGTAAISGDPFFDAEGKFLGYRGTGRDISKQVHADRTLREAKEAAEAASMAKSQFLANMSHELRTPLNAIIGFSEMLKRGMAGPLGEKQQEYAGLVHTSGQHLLNIINDILDLARVDAGKFELREEIGADPREIINSCVSLMKERARSEELSLTTELDRDPPSLVADPTRLKQILLNLLSNAIKFTEPGGSVVVAFHCDADGGVTFEVRDTGVGMTQDEIAIAMEPFGQVEADHTRRYEGTGLGLPLARRLAELHGGTLHVESEKGVGTTVIVTLPASRVLVNEPAEAVADPTPAK